MNKEFMARFRIEPKIWTAFKRYCKRVGKKPSEVIRTWIMEVL